jgi:hypothetical protein
MTNGSNANVDCTTRGAGVVPVPLLLDKMIDPRSSDAFSLFVLAASYLVGLVCPGF